MSIGSTQRIELLTVGKTMATKLISANEGGVMTDRNLERS